MSLFRRQTGQVVVEGPRRLEVAEGDTLVYRCPAKLSTGQRERLEEQLRGLWPKNRIVVLEDDATLDVIARPITAKQAFAAQLTGNGSVGTY